MLEGIIVQLKNNDDFTSIESPLHIETVWSISNDGTQINAVGEDGKVRIYFLDLGENYYILFAKDDEQFSYAAFWSWDDEIFNDLLKQLESTAKEA